MSRYKRIFFVYVKNKGNLLILKMLALCVVVSIIAIFVESRLRFVVSETAANAVSYNVTKIVNNAVNENIKKRSDYYSQMSYFERDLSGVLTAVKSDVVKENILKTEVVNFVTKQLDSMSETGIKIPLGTLLGNEFLVGRGPVIKIRLSDTEQQIEANFISSFSSAGINQTKHSIVMAVTVRLSIMLPGRIISTCTYNEFPISETIIIGKVPDSYTYIDDTESSRLSRINDYAENQAG